MIFWLTAAAVAGPDPFAACDLQARFFREEQRSLQQPTPDLWWLADDPCEGDTLAGGPPPTGDAVWCEERRGRRHGRQTSFEDGRVSAETQWALGQETGIRHTYDPKGRLVSTTALRNGSRHGEHIEIAPNKGLTISTWVRGEQQGPTWHVDARGTLILVSYWRDSVRHGRACAWRDGALEVDTEWRAGEPSTPPPDEDVPPEPDQLTLTPGDREEG